MLVSAATSPRGGGASQRERSRPRRRRGRRSRAAIRRRLSPRRGFGRRIEWRSRCWWCRSHQPDALRMVSQSPAEPLTVASLGAPAPWVFAPTLRPLALRGHRASFDQASPLSHGHKGAFACHWLGRTPLDARFAPLVPGARLTGLRVLRRRPERPRAPARDPARHRGLRPAAGLLRRSAGTRENVGSPRKGRHRCDADHDRS